MRKAGFRYRRVTLKLRYADFNTYTRSRLLHSDEGDATTLFAVVRELLRQLLHGRKRVRLVGVTVSSLTEPARQVGLFEKMHDNDKRERLNQSLDKTRDRHGFDAIMTAHSCLYHNSTQKKRLH